MSVQQANITYLLTYFICFSCVFICVSWCFPHIDFTWAGHPSILSNTFFLLCFKRSKNKTKKTHFKHDARPISMVCLKPVDEYSSSTQHYVTLHCVFGHSFGLRFNHCIVTSGCDSPKGLLFLLICSRRFLFLVRLTDYTHNEWRTEVFTATPDLVWMKQIKQPDFLQSFHFLLFQLHFSWFDCKKKETMLQCTHRERTQDKTN